MIGYPLHDRKLTGGSRRFLSRQYAAGIIVGIGLVLSFAHAFHAITHEKPLLATLIGSGVPLLFSTLIVYGGYWTYRQEWPEPYSSRLTGWTVLGGVGIGVLVGTISVHQYLAGHLPPDAWFQLATAITGGSLGGFALGVYVIRTHRRTNRIVALQRATHEFVDAKTKDTVCQRMVQFIATELQMPLAGVWLYESEREVLEPIAVTEKGERMFEEYPTYESGESLSWQAFIEGEPLILSTLADRSDLHNPDTIIESEMILPIGSHGVLNIGSREPNAFDSIDISTAKLLASATAAVLDRTDREEQLRAHRRELQKQNERLDEFTSVVSHDLRSPLTIAQGYLELATEECDTPALAEVETAHQRMEALITNLLYLARAGQTIEETTHVDLTETASKAWRMVDSTNASIEYPESEISLEADENRLRQLLENLFRNAIDHGGSEVTITVDSLTDGSGFYVADDGDGIPSADRDRVFETGYTTNDDGTGLGLVTVRRIAEAHGWSVAITESETGGARFDLRTNPSE